MQNGLINIILRASSQGSGFAEARDNVRNLSTDVSSFSRGIQNLGQSFGSAGKLALGFIKNLAVGGVWEIAAAGVRAVIGLYDRWKAKAEEAAKAEKAAFDQRIKAMDEYRAAIEKTRQQTVAAVNANLKRLNDETDATHALIKAELELEKARARRAGDAAGMAAADERLNALDAESAAEKLVHAMDAAETRIEDARKRWKGLVGQINLRADEPGQIAKIMADEIAEARERAAANAVGRAFVTTSGATMYAAATDEDRRAVADAAEAAYRESKRGKAFAEEKATLEKQLAEFRDAERKVAAEIAAGKAELANLGRRSDALLKQEDAKAINAAKDEEDARADAERKASEQRIANIRKEHEERMRLQRDELRAQLAAEQGRLSAAEARWQREFALWRSPELRAADDAAKERDRADRERLRREVSSRNYESRVAEAAELMRRGDESALKERFKIWRTGMFTDHANDMEHTIRAAAAYEARATSEEELRKIEANTADLAAKLDELISMKGGE